MEQTLKNKCIAVLIANGFNEAHLMETKTLLENAGGETVIISASTATRVKSRASDGGDEFFFDQPISNVRAEEYDALLLPGGEESIQMLLTHAEAVQFVTDFLSQKLPVAALGESNELLQVCGADTTTFTASAGTPEELEAAGQEILRLFASAPVTETQRHTA